MTKVLFVCLGNICRSPTAEGYFRKMVAQAGLEDHVAIDSAGTGSWHIGHPPDSRAIEAAAQRGIDLSGLRARQVDAQDIVDFDYVIAMDQHNLADLKALSDSNHQHKVRLFMDFAENFNQSEVPDPYYGGKQGFSTVLDMIEDASKGLLRAIHTNA